MNETLSTRQLRLVALLGLVVICAGAYLVLGRHHSSSPTAASSTPVSSTPARTTPATSKAHSQSSTPVKIDTHGFPLAVAKALEKHAVVVVSLVAPHAVVDGLASGEAKAGAAAMGAPFIALNVFHQRPGTEILRKLGITATPAVLVVTRRPYTVSAEFQGFVDRNVVEQAVADARG
jgi:hypothetical protein